MIKQGEGDLLASDAEALVNTVNTVGIMGKGIALQFKERFPDNFKIYAQAVKRGEVQTGKMFVVSVQQIGSPTKFIVNFPTKKDYKHRSNLEYIKEGLEDLRNVISNLGIRSIAIPPLGCGNGGLNWEDVRPLIVHALEDFPDLLVYLYEPKLNVYAGLKKDTRKERKVPLTQTRTMILSALDFYSVLGLESTLIEVQKLVYFLQRLQEPFPRLSFTKGLYGPFARTLQHMLYDLEGEYLTGTKFNEAKPLDPIALIPGMLPELWEAQNRLEKESRLRLEYLREIIDGFESPLGLELLATVDWVLNHDRRLMDNLSATIGRVHRWEIESEGRTTVVTRKQQTLQPELIRIAHKRLLGFEDILYG